MSRQRKPRSSDWRRPVIAAASTRTRSTGPRLAGYNIYYSTNAGGPFARAGSTNDVQSTVTGLASGTTYYFAVRAVSRRNVESADSNLAGAATTGLPPLPGDLVPVIAILH